MNTERKLELAIELLIQVSRELNPTKKEPTIPQPKPIEPTNLINIDTLTINFETFKKSNDEYLLTDSLNTNTDSKHTILATLKHYKIIDKKANTIRIKDKVKRAYKITDINKLDRLKQKN